MVQIAGNVRYIWFLRELGNLDGRRSRMSIVGLLPDSGSNGGPGSDVLIPPQNLN